MEDIKLVENCQWGDMSYFWELYDRYIDKIFKFIYMKTSDRQIAEDICSDVFMKAYKKIWTLELKTEKSFQSWVYTIANNSVIDFYRTQKHSVDIDEVFDLWEDINVHVDIDNKDKLAAVVELLNTFNKTHREIIMLRIWEDLSYKEISEITGSSVDNCKKIVSRGLKTIQANFVLLLLFIILL